MAVQEITASMTAPLRGAKRWAYITRASTLRVATTCEDGSIYLSPVWFVVQDKHIYLSLDAAGRHAVNFRQRRPMAALIDSGDEYATVAGVRIIGEAEEIVGDEPLISRLQELLFEKYFYVDHPYAEAYFEFGEAAGRKFFELVPERMIGWDSREVTTPQVPEARVLPDVVTDRRLGAK